MTYSVDPMEVLLPLLRTGLGSDVTVMASIPDGIPEFVPLVVCRRSGGASPAPTFYDAPFINIQVWAAGSDTTNPARAAFLVADRARQVLWEAWRNQTTTTAGHIAEIRESLGPIEVTDPDLPHFGRFQATYELRIRRARTVTAP